MINQNKNIRVFSQFLVILLILKLLASCEQKPVKVHEKRGQVVIETESYRFLVQKKGFCFSFQDRNRHIIVPPHGTSGLQIGVSPEMMVDAATARYEGNDGNSHLFSVDMAVKSEWRVEISLNEQSAQFKAIPKQPGRYSILFRAGGVTPGYGLGDNLIRHIRSGKAAVSKGKGTEITGFSGDDFRSGRERMISNFAIYPTSALSGHSLPQGYH